MEFIATKIILNGMKQSIPQLLKGNSMTGFLGRFSVILLLTACCTSSSLAQDIEGPAEGKIFVKVTRSRELVGAAIGLDAINFRAEFGDVSIPMAKIAGIKLHVNAEDSAVIALKNGDLVTGKISLDTVSLRTAWGKAHVKLDQIETIMADSKSRFFAETSAGSKGWRFSSGVTEAP